MSGFCEHQKKPVTSRTARGFVCELDGRECNADTWPVPDCPECKCPICEKYFSRADCQYAPKGYYERIVKKIRRAKKKEAKQ